MELLRDPATENRPSEPHARLLPAWCDGEESTGGTGPRVSVEDRLARLAAAFGPLRRVLGAIAARLIATRGYERLCYARLGDYARERAGLSARQLQELARVHRALAALPALERALVANELPWSKVRLVARVAVAADEVDWIVRARAMSTDRLEREVRERAGTLEPVDDPAEERLETRVTVRCTPAVCEKWSLVREMAERVAGQRLRAGEALELVAAEVFSATSIDAAFIEPTDAPPAPPERDAAQRAKAPLDEEATLSLRAPGAALPPAIASLATDLDAADAFEIDRRLRLAIHLAQTLDAAIAPLLRIVTSTEHEWRGRYHTLAAFVGEQLGMSPSKARALLRLERAADACPELRAAYRSGRLSWVKAHCLLPLVSLDVPGEWRPAWISWAERVTLRRLDADVERALLLRAAHHAAWQRCKHDPERAQDPIPPAERQFCAPEIDTEATQQLTWRVPIDVAALFRAVRETLRSRLQAERGGPLRDGELFETLLDCALVSWSARDPDAPRPDVVMERDGYRCAVPGCTSRRNLHDHHIIFRSAGGSNAPDNRVTLCAFHHQRCLHAGLLRLQGRAPDELVFELGLRADARPLIRYRSGDVVMAAQQQRAGSRGIGSLTDPVYGHILPTHADTEDQGHLHARTGDRPPARSHGEALEGLEVRSPTACR